MKTEMEKQQTNLNVTNFSKALLDFINMIINSYDLSVLIMQVEILLMEPKK